MKLFTDAEDKRSPITFTGEFEERRAAKFSLVPWNEYAKLSVSERAKIIAFYRQDLNIQIVSEKLTK